MTKIEKMSDSIIEVVGNLKRAKAQLQTLAHKNDFEYLIAEDYDKEGYYKVIIKTSKIQKNENDILDIFDNNSFSHDETTCSDTSITIYFSVVLW